MTDTIKARLTAAVADRYTVERELGGGGMSRVFVAMEHSLGRRVVIKTLPEDATFGNAAAERFRREILTAARIEHANIVPVLAAGDIEGVPYFVMPWVDGDSLRQLMQRGRVPLPLAVSILRDVARALAAAHAHGIVHRDIKPENILISGGAARVTDFGVAKALSAATQSGSSENATAQMTGLGMSIGTPAYMAPEQLAADPSLNHRADIYAWGLVAYELLSGKYPFEGMSGAGLMQAQLSTNPPALTTREPIVPTGLSDLVARTLAKDPAQRPQSANELVQALDDSAVTSSGESNRADTRSSDGDKSGAGKSSSRKWGAVIAIAIIATGAGFGAWKINQTLVSTSDKVIAVAPFKVSGAVQPVHYLREGVADLMVPQLASIDSMHPVSSRQMFDSWRRAAGSMDVDLEESEALKTAAKLGAGQLVLGTIAGTAQNLVISASLKRVRNGATIASDTVQGVADSAVAMTARLTSKLLLLSEGATKERIRAVMQANPAAITSFLNGEHYYRSGRYADALKQFRESYAADSTFPLVSLRIYTVNGWLPTDAFDGPWVARALAHRNRLTGADSLLLEAYVDPGFPAGTPPLENMERVWKIAQRANSAELWYVAADNYMHNGAAVGYPDPIARALEGFKKAEAIDSSYVGGLEHQPAAYLMMGDTIAARAANRRQARVDSTGDFHVVSDFLLRSALAKPGELAAIGHQLASAPSQVAVDAAGFMQSLATLSNIPLTMTVVDSVLASKRIVSELAVDSYEFLALQDSYLNSGRVAEAQQLMARDTSRTGAARLILGALFSNGDTIAANRAATRLNAWRSANRDTTGTVVNIMPRFAVALWALDRGDAATAKQILAELRAYRAPASNVAAGYASRIYAQLLEARMAVNSHAPNASQLVRALDSAIVVTPRLDRRDVRSVTNLMIAGMAEETGNDALALKAARRRDMQLALSAYASAFVRLRANAAEKLGDTQEAISALRTYIDMRQRADAALQPDVQAAKDRLKALEKKS
ncbi:MAG: serine/threonine-protein kinase [Gemmatimonadaceae bacterium]